MRHWEFLEQEHKKLPEFLKEFKCYLSDRKHHDKQTLKAIYNHYDLLEEFYQYKQAEFRERDRRIYKELNIDNIEQSKRKFKCGLCGRIIQKGYWRGTSIAEIHFKFGEKSRKRKVYFCKPCTIEKLQRQHDTIQSKILTMEA